MIEKFLTSFHRASGFAIQADLGEKLGNIGLGLLRIGFGKTVSVQKISNNRDIQLKPSFAYPISVRIAAIALYAITFPITIPLTLIGCIGATLSTSHKQLFSAFQSQILHQERPTGHGRVNFQGARARDFDKVAEPMAVAEQESYVILPTTR